MSKGEMMKYLTRPWFLSFMLLFFVSGYLIAQNRIPELFIDTIFLDDDTIATVATDGDLNLSPDGTGTVVVTTDLDVDNINIDANTISSTDTNGVINLFPDGTGSVEINTQLNVDNLRLDGNTISSTDTDGNVVVTPDGTGLLTTDNLSFGGNTVASTDTNGDLNLTPDGTGTVVVGTDLDVDNLNLDLNTLSSTDTNGDINLTPNGTGSVVISTDLDIGNINITGNTISSTDTNGDINMSPNGTGTVVVTTDLDVDNLNLNGNSIISTDTNGNIVLTPDGTGLLTTDNVTIGTNTISTSSGDLILNSASTVIEVPTGSSFQIEGGLSLTGNTLTSTVTNANITVTAGGASGRISLVEPTTVGSQSVHADSALAIDSVDGGFLPPRMDESERDAIGTPTAGLIVYNTDTSELNVYNGTAWVAVGGAAEEPFLVTANLGGASPTLGTSSIATYTEITSATLDLVQGVGSSGIPCDTTNDNDVGDLTCSVGSEGVGIIVSPTESMDLEVCMSFSHRTEISGGGSVFAGFQVIKTDNGAQTGQVMGGARMISTGAINGNAQRGMRVCGYFAKADIPAGKNTFRLMYEQSASASILLNAVDASRNAARGQPDVHIVVRQTNAPVSSTVSVISPRAGQTQICTAYIANSGTPTITRSDGGCVSGLVDNGVGNIQINFAGGTFSGDPNCMCTTRNSISVTNCQVVASIVLDKDGLRIGTNITDTMVAIDTDFMINCTGPK